MPARIVLRDPILFPIQAFFNAVSDSSFVKVVDHLTNGVGFAVNDTDCTFPTDLDPCEELFEGVRFSLFEDQVVISKDQLRHYLQIVCDAFIIEHPEDKDVISKFFDRYHSSMK